MKSLINIILMCCPIYFITACPNSPESDYQILVDPRGGEDPSGVFYVYKDSGYSFNNFVPSGWMGDSDSIEVDYNWTENVFDGQSCQKWIYKSDQRLEGWSGVIWQDPEDNWDGDIAGAGYDLDDSILLVFHARGEKGGEIVSFGIGGLEGIYPDSVEEQNKKIVLNKSWTEYSIVVNFLDLSSVHNGFMWTIDSAENESGDISFYLDEIRFEKDYIDQTDRYKLPGMCFSPFRDGKDPNIGDKVTVEQVRDHMKYIAPYTDGIRTYGMDEGLAEAGTIAHEFNLKIAMGAWIDQYANSNDQELSLLVNKALAGEVDVAVIGNEVLHRRDLEVSELITLINEFKSQVPHVPVTTSEVYNHWIEYPELIEACDLIYIHCYPFWDGVSIDDSIKTIDYQYNRVVKLANGKPVVISETGWPSDGTPNGDAVPTEENAAKYFLNFNSWAQGFEIPFFYFESFDEPFKANYEPNEVGDHWGIFESDLSMKNKMGYVFSGHKSFDYWSRELPCGEGEPSIEFTFVPPIGSDEYLRGKVCHVWPKDYAIAVYINVGSGWWTKPFFDRPLTWIQADGTFSTNIVTGGVDDQATAIAAFLVPVTYTPQEARGGSLPASIQNDATAEFRVDR
jgi:exo-beta-1,3-glucanase (GH17 family)